MTNNPNRIKPLPTLVGFALFSAGATLFGLWKLDYLPHELPESAVMVFALASILSGTAMLVSQSLCPGVFAERSSSKVNPSDQEKRLFPCNAVNSVMAN